MKEKAASLDPASSSTKISKEFLISILLLMLMGTLMRSLSHGEEIPLRKTFSHFPLQLSQWSGKELGLKQDVLKVLKVNDYMMRQYQRTQGPQIGLYVGYYQSQKQGATYHSPKNCLPGSGWSIVKTEKMSLDLTDIHGVPIQVNRLVIQKGLEKQWMLYWYQDRGRIITNEYWAKGYLMWDAITKNRTDGAFVRVTLPFTEKNENDILSEGKIFTEAIYPLLKGYLPS
jgi:EpsI family protein